MRSQWSTRVGSSELHLETGLAQHCEKPSPTCSDSNRKDWYQNIGSNVIPAQQNQQSLPETKEYKSSSALETLPLLNLSIPKHDRHRSQKRAKCVDTKPESYSASNSRQSVDNQTAHLILKNRIGHDTAAEGQTKAKRWAATVDTHCIGIDENFLPHLVVRPAVLSLQKLSSPLRKLHIRQTWNGSLKPQGDNGTSRSSFNTLQRRTSSSHDTLTTFEATETILLAEIDSDERCANFLRQRLPRETLVSQPSGDDFPQSQIYYKLRALDRKIQMNREKLAQVRERIAVLGGKPRCLDIAPEEAKPEFNDYSTKKTGRVEDMHQSPKLLDTNQESRASTSKKTPSIAASALVIQCTFRAFQARLHLANLLTKTYQRVLNPGSNQYFYYNRVTRLSQWETPTLLRRCHCSLDASPKQTSTRANATKNGLDAAANVIQTMIRQRALRVFVQDLKLGNLEKVFDAGFGAWYYFNSRTNRSFWESVHHVRLTAANSAIYHRHQPWQAT